MEAISSTPTRGDANSWEPAPKPIREILSSPEGVVQDEWMKSIRKELKTLVDANTFSTTDSLLPGKTSTQVMETFKVTMKSDGSLDKLKTRLVVRGDIQDKNISEDKWSPTASFRALKMFFTHACRLSLLTSQD
jgi:hypothetical protein